MDIDSGDEQAVTDLIDKVHQLEISVAAAEAKVDTIERSQLVVSQSYSAIYDSSLFWYSTVLSIVAVVVAIAGVAGFLLIRSYKRREVNQLVDQAKENLDELFSNEKAMASYIAGAMKTDTFEKSLDTIKNELFTELSNDIKSWVDDQSIKIDSEATSDAGQQDIFDDNSKNGGKS